MFDWVALRIRLFLDKIKMKMMLKFLTPRIYGRVKTFNTISVRGGQFYWWRKPE